MRRPEEQKQLRLNAEAILRGSTRQPDPDAASWYRTVRSDNYLSYRVAGIVFQTTRLKEGISKIGYNSNTGLLFATGKAVLHSIVGNELTTLEKKAAIAVQRHTFKPRYR